MTPSVADPAAGLPLVVRRCWGLVRRAAAVLALTLLSSPSGHAAQGPAHPAVGSASAPPLRLVANPWEPYVGEALPGGGLATRLVQTALTRAGYRSEVRMLPWARALTMTLQGQADGIVAIWPTRERHAGLLFSQSYLSNDLTLFYRPDLASVPQRLDDLRGLTVGVGRGYDYSDEFLRADHFQKDVAMGLLPNLLKLSRGRVDLVLEDPRAVYHQIAISSGRHPELLQLKVAPSPLLRLPLHFGISRQRPDASLIIERFNRELEAMRRDGSLQALLARDPVALSR